MGSVHSSAASPDERCPVDHKNMTTEASSVNNPQPETTNRSRKPATESSRCPIQHKNITKQQIAPFLQNRTPHKPTNQNPPSKSTVYDVYGQELDRANLMPATPNQLPSPGQKQPLSTDRVKSAIPKSGDNDTWIYPSPQMFYNALKRKGRADGAEESDMNIIVDLHNAMNERTWNEIMQWEQKYHCSQCDNPKLKTFKGRPDDLSPAARFRTWFRGYPRPFDRHDWIIDRCGQQDARYVIDYYSREGPDPVEIHVRPALDSFSAAFDRIRSALHSIQEAALAPGPDSVQGGNIEPQSGFSKQTASHVVLGDQLDKSEFDFLSSLTTADIKDIAEDVNTSCAKVSDAFREAGEDPEKMERANVSVNYCMAQRICKTEAADFMSALENGSDETEAYARMTSCLERFHIVARRVILEEAGIVQSGPEFPAGVTPSVSPSRNPAPASSIE